MKNVRLDNYINSGGSVEGRRIYNRETGEYVGTAVGAKDKESGFGKRILKLGGAESILDLGWKTTK